MDFKIFTNGWSSSEEDIVSSVCSVFENDLKEVNGSERVIFVTSIIEPTITVFYLEDRQDEVLYED